MKKNNSEHPLKGILRIALKLLMNDRGKCSALLMGITFSVFLMVMMTSMFAGILTRASSSVINVGARVWVLDPAVTNLMSSIPLPSHVLDVVRSTAGVRHAEPIYFGGALVKMQNGSYQAVTVVGLDDATLFGRPELEAGKIDDIFAENGFIVVDDAEYAKLDHPKLADEFEINDHRARIVGIAKAAVSGLFGVPTLYTTFSRATSYIPTARFKQSYLLVEPVTEADIPQIQQTVAQLGYQALTSAQLVDKISRFYKYQTGLGINVLLMTVISFIVGLSISGQTFYAFILENIKKFGALKAIGAKSAQLTTMILAQAVCTSLIGYGLGVGLATLLMVTVRARMPSYAAQLNYWNLGFALVMVLIIAAFSSYIGIRKVLKIQPFDIFRG